MFLGMYPCSHQWQSRSCSGCSSAGFPLFKTSDGMPSLPGAIPYERQSMALLSSSMVGWVSNSTMTGSSGMAFRAVSVTVICIAYSLRWCSVQCCICFSWSVMTSPVLDLSGAVLVGLGPVAFFMPSYIRLVFPVSADVCILVQRFSHYVLSQWRAVCLAFFLAALRALSVLGLGLAL